MGLAGHSVPTTVTVTEVVHQFAEPRPVPAGKRLAELPMLDVELWDDPR